MTPPSCAASPPAGDGAHCDGSEFFVKAPGNLKRVMLRRGGAPSGAVASIVMGVWGHLPPSLVCPLFPTPPSQSTAPPVFGPYNVAKYCLIYSRRRTPRYSRPDSAFLGIITSRIQRVGGKEVRPGPQRAPISMSIYRGFLRAIIPHPTRQVARFMGADRAFRLRSSHEKIYKK
jgi:hypothetical protein